jgi:hypothetical protein
MADHMLLLRERNDVLHELLKRVPLIVFYFLIE